ncbi:hypothetical protein [Sinomonas sp. B1-1]|uniref:hypothetical protein n=1 Tax=Sinomonas sp. B1-1 TaxID=3141454 RepID=UPI003D265321
MSTPGNAPRRNPYRDPSAYWPDGVPPGSTSARGSRGLDGLVPDGQRHGELARRGEASPSSAGSRRSEPRQPRPPKPASRLATFLGVLCFAAGLTTFTVGFIPGGWGAFLASGPLVFAALAGWGSFARSKARAARISGMAIAGVALSALHVALLMFVR